MVVTVGRHHSSVVDQEMDHFVVAFLRRDEKLRRTGVVGQMALLLFSQ